MKLERKERVTNHFLTVNQSIRNTVAAIIVENIRRHNQDRDDDYDQSHYDDYDRW